jgi:phosphoenolpyruvate carboxylase
MRVASYYAGLVTDERLRAHVLAAIFEEYGQARAGVLAVTGQQRLLDNVPTLRDSIDLRNPYVDPIHAAQVRLLRELRQAMAAGNEAEIERLRYVVEHTINGIAAGLQSTG